MLPIDFPARHERQRAREVRLRAPYLLLLLARGASREWGTGGDDNLEGSGMRGQRKMAAAARPASRSARLCGFSGGSAHVTMPRRVAKGLCWAAAVATRRRRKDECRVWTRRWRLLRRAALIALVPNILIILRASDTWLFKDEAQTASMRM